MHSTEWEGWKQDRKGKGAAEGEKMEQVPCMCFGEGEPNLSQPNKRAMASPDLPLSVSRTEHSGHSRGGCGSGQRQRTSLRPDQDGGVSSIILARLKHRIRMTAQRRRSVSKSHMRRPEAFEPAWTWDSMANLPDAWISAARLAPLQTRLLDAVPRSSFRTALDPVKAATLVRHADVRTTDLYHYCASLFTVRHPTTVSGSRARANADEDAQQ
nr:hypothetical protein CFP56_57854 [Quercus suber]